MCAPKDSPSTADSRPSERPESHDFAEAQFSFRIPVSHFDLAATLQSGQTFRWRQCGDAWQGVVDNRWLRVRCRPSCLEIESTNPARDALWCRDYFQVDLDLDEVFATFPQDPLLLRAIRAFGGLRLLRQPLWECLASFLLSSTKRITQIQECIDRLCRAYGVHLQINRGSAPSWTFPAPTVIARLRENQLRQCGLGFRAPYLLETAKQVDSKRLDLEGLRHLKTPCARRRLMELPGVGEKIADCVLLFAYGRMEAFPVDVWIARALRQAYFGGRSVPLHELRVFAAEHFGPYAGYAQQYFFHYARCYPDRLGRTSEPKVPARSRRTD